jgi:hypothetical protein
MDKLRTQRYAESLYRVIQNNHYYLKGIMNEFEEKCMLVTSVKTVPPRIVIEIPETYRGIKNRLNEINAIQQLLRAKYFLYLRKDPRRDKEITDLGHTAKTAFSKFEHALKQIEEEGRLKAEERPAEAEAKAEEKLAEVEVKAEEKPAEVEVKAEEKLAEVEVKAEEKLAEVEVKAEERPAEAEVKAEERPAEAEVKAEEKPAEAEVKAEEKPAEAEVKAEEKPAEAEVKAEEKPAEVEVKEEEKPAEVEVKAEERPAEIEVKASPFLFFQDQENQVMFLRNWRILGELDYEISGSRVEEKREVSTDKPRSLTLFVFKGDPESVDELQSHMNFREHDVIERYRSDELRGILTHLREVQPGEVEKIFERFNTIKGYSSLKCLLIPIRSQKDYESDIIALIEEAFGEMTEGEMRTLSA